ncbi:MAG: sigma-70 family RNA polymerase sigma factor [Acidimicrobiia bacterium]|jgi:RNA polymerase sigma-70 factor (ECF subfamily)
MTAADARFVEVYSDLFRYVYAYCRRRTPADRLDDAVSEVFLAVWRRIDEVPDGSEILPWLYSVAYGVLSNQRRSAFRRRNLDQKLAAIGVEVVKAPEEFVVTRHESEQVLQAANALKAKEREILRLSIWEDLSHSEVAAVLGISVDSAKQRLSRARKSLTREYNRLENRRSRTPAAQKGGVS